MIQRSVKNFSICMAIKFKNWPNHSLKTWATCVQDKVITLLVPKNLYAKI